MKLKKSRLVWAKMGLKDFDNELRLMRVSFISIIVKVASQKIFEKAKNK